MMSEVLDCRGLKCPQPVIEAKRRLDTLESGTLAVLVDHKVQAQNVERAAIGSGNAAQIEDNADYFSVLIEKPSECELMLEEGNPASGDVALLLTSDCIGADAKLGAILAPMFLHAVSEADAKPQVIALLNTGVRLACEGSEALESLRALEDAGAEILVCGTCLDYFHLMDQIGVGVVSNMFTIYETLAKAGKVIAP